MLHGRGANRYASRQRRARSWYEGLIISVAQQQRGDSALVWAARQSDVREAESRLAAHIGSGEAAAVLQGSRIRSELANYKRQYWGVVRDGQRELLITFVHRTSSLVEAGQWKTVAVLLEGGGYLTSTSTGTVVQGGGERHFRVPYSIESKRFGRLQVHSPIRGAGKRMQPTAVASYGIMRDARPPRLMRGR